MCLCMLFALKFFPNVCLEGFVGNHSGGSRCFSDEQMPPTDRSGLPPLPKAKGGFPRVDSLGQSSRVWELPSPVIKGSAAETFSPEKLLINLYCHLYSITFWNRIIFQLCTAAPGEKHEGPKPWGPRWPPRPSRPGPAVLGRGHRGAPKPHASGRGPGRGRRRGRGREGQAVTSGFLQVPPDDTDFYNLEALWNWRRLRNVVRAESLEYRSVYRGWIWHQTLWLSAAWAPICCGPVVPSSELPKALICVVRWPTVL